MYAQHSTAIAIGPGRAIHNTLVHHKFYTRFPMKKIRINNGDGDGCRRTIRFDN